MPLVKCGECQQPVSTAAATCPNCGAPVKPKPNYWAVGIPLIATGLVAAGVIYLSIDNQKVERAKAELDEVNRRAAAYIRLSNLTPKPTPRLNETAITCRPWLLLHLRPLRRCRDTQPQY